MDTKSTAKKELGLYLHIPFCIRKCNYCDFLSAPAPEDVRRAYIEKMLLEIQALAGRYPEFRVSTIFIGGGTPSILAAAALQRLLEQVWKSFDVSADAEITVECNPGTLDLEKLRIYRASGINRLSIGLQSADDRQLRLLGRIHTYEQFVSNYLLAREIGFQNINIDLMSALPGQDVSNYEQTLYKTIGLEPEHISAYSLLIEEGTPFFSQYGQAQEQRSRGGTQHLLPSEETERLMYVRTKELLQAAGYHRYEISNYARPGYACRHNIGYWTRKNYLGFGIGAASMVENVRFSNTSDIEQYLSTDFRLARQDPCNKKKDGDGVRRAYCSAWHENVTDLNRQAQMEEFMFLGLRMMRGVAAGAFYEQFSEAIEEIYGDVLRKQIGEKLLQKTQTGYALTDYGIDVSNYVFCDYLLDEPANTNGRRSL